MAEYETITVKNITGDDFSVRFNGEMYSIAKDGEKVFPRFLGFHAAKYMSDSILGNEAKEMQNADSQNPYAPAASQLMIHDNPRRRILLYDILGDTTMVEECVNSYPLKAFIGEMETYLDYVTESEKKAYAKKNPEPKGKVSKGDEVAAEDLVTSPSK